MAIYRNLTVSGKVFTRNDKVFFSGKDTNGTVVGIKFKNGDKNTLGVKNDCNLEDFKQSIHDSISTTISTYINKNNRLSASEIQALRESIGEKTEKLLKGEKISFLVASAAGFYDKKAKALALESSIEPVETDKGTFYPIKITEFQNKLPIDMKVKYRKDDRIRNATLADIDNINPDEAIFIASPVKTLSNAKDYKYLFEINKNSIEFNKKMIEKNGDTPTFQNSNYADSKNNITPQIRVYTQKSVLRHLSGEYGAIESVFKATDNKFKIPLTVNGKSIKIDGDNLEEFKKDKPILNACMTYILSKTGNSYEKLFKLLKVDENAAKEAKVVDQFNHIVKKMNEQTTIKGYFKNTEKLESLIDKYGIENSPINIETFVSMLDSRNKYNNDSSYREGFKKNIKTMLNDVKKEVEKHIKAQIMIYKNSPTELGKSIYAGISKRVELVYDNNGKNPQLEYKKDDKGKTILNYIPIAAKGQLPILRSEQYPPISLKGAINNNPTFSGFSNRAIEVDTGKILSLLGIPTVVSKQKREISIDSKNDKNENLYKDNRGRKPAQKTETKAPVQAPAEAQTETKAPAEAQTETKAPTEAQTETKAPTEAQTETKAPTEAQTETKAPVQAEISFDTIEEIEVDKDEAKSLQSSEVNISLEDMEEFLKDPAPSAGKAEAPSVTAPSI